MCGYSYKIEWFCMSPSLDQAVQKQKKLVYTCIVLSHAQFVKTDKVTLSLMTDDKAPLKSSVCVTTDRTIIEQL